MKSLFLVALLLTSVLGHSQSLTELRARKINMEQVIKYTAVLISQARLQERGSMNRLQLITVQIRNRKVFIQNMNDEIQFLSYWINQNEQALNLLQGDWEALKKEYVAMIRFARKNENNDQLFVFLLSAKDFNQAYRRFLYLRQYAGYRKVQAHAIEALSQEITAQVSKLQKRKAEKQQLVDEKLDETFQLKREIHQQQESIRQLQEQQQDLKRQLQQQQQEQQQLNKEIEDLVTLEARQSEQASGAKLNSEQEALTREFQQQRGKLSWPVRRGIITSHFGVHSHPVMKQIQIRNNGIDISTNPGARARAVYSGTVSRIFVISGENKTVILRHGSYLTVYSNLSQILVKTGQKVDLNQPVGFISTDKENSGQTILKFQLWKENQKQNPEIWLASKR